MGLWKEKEVFPMIVRVIRELHEKSRGFIHHSSIEVGFLNDSTAGRLVRNVSRERGTTPEWEAMEMVAWFSQKYPGSLYEKEFERHERGDGYLYRPRHAATQNLYPDEIQVAQGAKFVCGPRIDEIEPWDKTPIRRSSNNLNVWLFPAQSRA
jgi:hypothetical protein